MEVVGSEVLEENIGWDGCKGVVVPFLLSRKGEKKRTTKAALGPHPASSSDQQFTALLDCSWSNKNCWWVSVGALITNGTVMHRNMGRMGCQNTANWICWAGGFMHCGLCCPPAPRMNWISLLQGGDEKMREQGENVEEKGKDLRVWKTEDKEVMGIESYIEHCRRKLQWLKSVGQ